MALVLIGEAAPPFCLADAAYDSRAIRSRIAARIACVVVALP